jgi:cobalamin biosynthesis Mg chelatase CobN
MLHFTNYNRSYTVGESLSDVTADYETIKVTPTEYGLAFTTKSFSPFALLWTAKSNTDDNTPQNPGNTEQNPGSTEQNQGSSSNTTTSSTTQSSSSSSRRSSSSSSSSSDSTTTSQFSLLPQTDEPACPIPGFLLPLTGDTNHIILWLILAGASLAAIWALCRSIRRKRQ